MKETIPERYENKKFGTSITLKLKDLAVIKSENYNASKLLRTFFDLSRQDLTLTLNDVWQEATDGKFKRQQLD